MLDTPTDLAAEAVKAIADVLNVILANSHALYLKTKNFIGMSAAHISATTTLSSTSRPMPSSAVPMRWRSRFARLAALLFPQQKQDSTLRALGLGIRLRPRQRQPRLQADGVFLQQFYEIRRTSRSTVPKDRTPTGRRSRSKRLYSTTRWRGTHRAGAAPQGHPGSRPGLPMCRAEGDLVTGRHVL